MAEISPSGLPRFFGGDGKRNTADGDAMVRTASEKARQGISFMPDTKTFDGGNPVFVDAAAMKEKVRQNLTKRKHTVLDYYKTHGLPQRIARSPLFENCTLSIIAFNAIWIAIDTDHNDAEMLLDAHLVFQIAENFFCFFFSFEWLVRYLSFRRKRDCMKDAWFIFDSMLVATMVLETWALNAFALVSSGGSGGGLGNASILRIARLLRLSRMARMARLLRAMPELMVLIKGMMAATRSVFFTLCLLILILYVFAIAFKQLCADTEMGSRYFSDVAASMYTLLVHGALLDDVSGFSYELGSESVVIAAIFFLFSLLAALTVMNMLIGVLCEVVSAVAATEKEEMLVTYVNGKLQQVVDLLDVNGDNQISKKEFVCILENVDAARALQEVGVDVVGLIDFAEFIFVDESVEDGEQSEKVLAFSEFMEVVLQLRGSNGATVKDVVDLRKFIRRALIQTNSQLSALQRVMRTSGYMSKTQSELGSDERLSRIEKKHVTDTNLQIPRSEKYFQDAADLNAMISSLDKEQAQSKVRVLYPESDMIDFTPIPPRETPSPNLLHYRVQENERLLWGDKPSSLCGQWHPLEEVGITFADGDLFQWRDTDDYPHIEVDVLRRKMSILSKVLNFGLAEVNKISEGLHRDVLRNPNVG